MKKIYFLMFVMVIFLGAKAQPVYHWMNQLGGLSTDGGGYIAVDRRSNVFTASFINSNASFRPGTIKEVKFIKSTSAGSNHLILTKVDAAGNLLWSRQFVENISPSTITTDTSNNVIIAGSFFNTVDFDPGPSVFNLTSNNAADIFIMKLDSAGNFLWAGAMGGKNADRSYSLVSDLNNNLAIICEFNDTIDVDFSASGVHRLIATTPGEKCVLKLNSSGAFLWAHHLKDIYPGALAFNRNGDLYTTGYFFTTQDFDFSSGIFNMTSTGVASSTDAYILKENGSGSFLWAKSFGEFVNRDNPTSIIVDQNNNVLVAGNTSAGNSDFDPGSGTLNLVGNTDFILKLDNSGNYIWAKGIYGGTVPFEFTSIGVDDSNNVFTIGNFNTSVDFDPGPGSSVVSTLAFSNGFILKLDSSGNFAFVNALKSTEALYANTLHVAQKGNLYIGGQFTLKVDFDPGPATKIDSSMGSSDVFTLKLSRCLSNSSLALNECKHFELAGHRFDTSEIIDILFTAKDGCDSVVTVNVTVKKVNDTISASGSTLSAKSLVGTSYQWVTCPSYTVIPGATSTTYVATTSGNYALMITENGCTDTSDCLYVTGVGIDEYSSNHQIKVFPNPAKDIVSIEGLEQGSSIKLLSIVGQEISSQTVNGTQSQLSLKNLVPGLYLLQLKTESGVVSTMKIVKE